MHAYAYKLLISLSPLALGGCDLKRELVGETLPGAESSSSAGVDATDGASSNTTDGATGTTGADATTGEDATTGADATTSADEPAACVGIDHETCYPAVLEACLGEGRWDDTPECSAAVVACYPMGPPALAVGDVIQFCIAELSEGCLFNDGPGCGETFCACTAGAFPYDWDNCWHLTLLACMPGFNSDCAQVLGGCYPGATVPELEACQQQVMETVGDECNCPMCSIHEQCEVALDACLGG
jgi:hypothetical protein